MSALIVSTLASSATLYHPLSIPAILTSIQVPQHDSNTNYNFAYEVNDVHSGDVKSQSETKNGDVVLGQYTLLQPDGVTRKVDYQADSLNGFTATVNNNKPIINTDLDKQNDNANDDNNEQE